jgi:hypothetical protein
MMVKAGFAAVGGGDKPLELSLLRHDDPWAGWSTGGSAPAPPIPLGGPSTSPEDAPAPESSGVESAREAALRASAPEVLEAVGGKSVGKGEGSADAAEQAVASLPAAMSEPKGVERTPLDQLEKKDKEAERELKERMTETMLTGGGNGRVDRALAASLPAGVSVDVVTSGGPNQVQITAEGGLLGSLTENQLDAILATGDTTLLGAPVLNLLQSTGTNALTFTQQLKSLLR